MTDFRPSLTLMPLLLTALIGCDAGAGPAQVSAAPQGPAAEAAPAPAVDACLTCHAGPMSLAGKDPATVAARLREIVAGSKPHPPLQLGDTSDAALESLAQRLTSGKP